MHLGRKYLILLLFTGAFFQSKAQEANVDAVSWQLYQSCNWKSLSSFCDSAIGKGFDYYYLRLRAGIACYELQQYRRAIPHFQKARTFNHADQVAGPYLYYCYLASSEYEEASWLRKSLTADSALAAGMNLKKQPALAFIHAEGALKVTSAANYQTADYASLGLQHFICKKYSLYHSFSFYGQKEFRYTIRQYEYYLRPVIPFRHGFSLTLGLHALYDYTIRTQQAPPDDTLHTGAPPDQENTPEKSIGFAGGFTLTKHGTFFDYSAGATGSYIDSTFQNLVDVSILYFPFRNNRLSFGGHAYLHTQDAFKTSYVGFSPVLDAKICKRVSVAASWFWNVGENISENTAYLINNSEDLTTSRGTAGVYVKVTKAFTLYGIYSYENKLETKHSSTYHYDIFLAGIRYVPGGN